MNEGKKFSLSFKADSAKQLILERLRSLTIISSLAFVVAGLTISSDSDFIKNINLAYISFLSLIILSLFSFGYYILSIRKDIIGLYEEIIELSDEDWSQPLKREKFKLGYLTELLYIFFVIAVFIFVLSLF